MCGPPAQGAYLLFVSPTYTLSGNVPHKSANAYASGWHAMAPRFPIFKLAHAIALENGSCTFRA